MQPVGHCGFQWVSVGSDNILGTLAGFVWADAHQSVFITCLDVILDPASSPQEFLTVKQDFLLQRSV